MEKEIALVREEDIKDLLDNSEIIVQTVFDKSTLVTCKLPNGFVLSESSGAVDKRTYSEEIGAEICMAKIEDKLWVLEGYALQKKLAEEQK